MFYDSDGNLICNPVMYMMALAFADDAFKNNFNCPEAISGPVVPPESDRIRLRWKDSWAKTPIRSLRGIFPPCPTTVAHALPVSFVGT
jgi:hypothetical protein